MATFDHTTTSEEIAHALANEISGKTVLITGTSTGGVGARTALSLAASAPAHLLLAGRNESKIRPVIDEISRNHPDVKVTFVALDLGDLASVRRAAAKIQGSVDKLDVLINNAGLASVKPYSTTVDGIELQFGTNHVGHFLLTNLLMPQIFAAGRGARIISVSSLAYICFGSDLETANFDDVNFKHKEYDTWRAYGQSKTANIVFASALAARLKSKGVLAFSLTPGVIVESYFSSEMAAADWQGATDSWIKGLGDDTPPAGGAEPVPLTVGAANEIYAGFSPDITGYSGSFVNRCAILQQPLKSFAKGKDNEDKLWALSEKLVGEEFSWN